MNQRESTETIWFVMMGTDRLDGEQKENSKKYRKIMKLTGI